MQIPSVMLTFPLFWFKSLVEEKSFRRWEAVSEGHFMFHRRKAVLNETKEKIFV